MAGRGPAILHKPGINTDLVITVNEKPSALAYYLSCLCMGLAWRLTVGIIFLSRDPNATKRRLRVRVQRPPCREAFVFQAIRFLGQVVGKLIVMIPSSFHSDICRSTPRVSADRRRRGIVQIL